MKLKNFPQFLLLFLLIACSKDTVSTEVPPDPVVDRSENLLATGDSAPDFLGNENFQSLLVEIAYVQGFRPTAQAVQALEDFLRERTFKQTIDFEYLPLESPGEEELTLEKIDALEKEHRTAYNQHDRLALYIYFADAPSSEDQPEEGKVTLGSVYRNTSMVIFEKTIRTLAGRDAFITDADLETATLQHEFGHLFGLVNLGSPEVNPHENADAPHHCITEGCLMQAELQFGGSMAKHLRQLKAKGASLPQMGPECIRDLQANGGK